jgi:L-fucose mutarotase/ribose pyranase (RbsD/FucU family)
VDSTISDPVTFQVPASLDEAIGNLNGLAALLTAKQWERAAIVYAFTEPGENRFSTGRSGRYTLADFARLNIAGLRDEETVAWVREAWQDAIKDGQTIAVQPGDHVALPDRDFPKHPRTRTAYDGFRVQLRQRPDAIRELVRDEPEIATMIAAQAINTPSVRHAIEAKLAEPIREREVYERPEPKRDYSEDLIRGINLLIPVVRAVQRGQWQPSPAEAMLLHSLGMLLDQAASPEAAPQDDLFTQIERHLKEGIA